MKLGILVVACTVQDIKLLEAALYWFPQKVVEN